MQCNVSAPRATLALRDTLAQALPGAPVPRRAVGRQQLCRRPTATAARRSAYARRCALAHILRAPGQLGLGRAYVSGEIEVDDMDAALELLDGYQVPPFDARGKARLAAAAVRAGALRTLPRTPTAELRPAGDATAASETSARSATTTTSPTSSSS